MGRQSRVGWATDSAQRAVAPRSLLTSGWLVGLVGLLAMTGLGGCEILDDPEDAMDVAGSSARRVGPEGGEVVSSDGRVRVVIPAGALLAEEFISIQDTSGVPAGHLGDAYQIGPSGLVFQADVQVVFSYAGYGVGDPSALAVATIFRGEWRPLPFGGRDPERLTVAGLTQHLSPFGLIDATGTRPLTPAEEPCEGRPSECLPTCIDNIRVTRECRRTEGGALSACAVAAQLDCAAVAGVCALGECVPGSCEVDGDCASGCTSRFGHVAGQCVSGACQYQSVACPQGDCAAGTCQEAACTSDTDCPPSCDGDTVISQACGTEGRCELAGRVPCEALGQECTDGACSSESCHMDSDCPTGCAGATARQGSCGVDGACLFEAIYCPLQGHVCVDGQCGGGACSVDADCAAFCDGNDATGGVCVAGQCDYGSVIDCSARGQLCRDGLCVTDTSGCDSNCTGCCQGGVCLDGAVVAACGTGGQTCAVCPLHHDCDGGSCGCVSDCDTPGSRTCVGPDQVQECQEVVRTPTPCYRNVVIARCSQASGSEPLVCRAGQCAAL